MDGCPLCCFQVLEISDVILARILLFKIFFTRINNDISYCNELKMLIRISVLHCPIQNSGDWRGNHPFFYYYYFLFLERDNDELS